MPKKREYPTNNWKFDNGGVVLWKRGLFKTSDSPNLMVRFLCSARTILGKDCPKKGHVQAASVLRKGQRYRALHPECHRKIKGLIVVRATFPNEDVTLKPGGSEVLWTKAHRIEIEENGRVERRRWCVPVICGGCRERRDVTVRRGLGEERELTADDLVLDAGATGECALYCRDCWLQYFRRDLSLPDGSEVFFSRWDLKGLPIFCGECQSEQTASVNRAASYEGFTLPCPGCGHLIGEVEHVSRAKIRWLDRKPVRKYQQSKVAFICAHCDGKHYVFPENTKRDDWCGRSDECKRIVNDKRIVEDKKSEVSNTWARFSTEKDDMVTIDYEKCPHRPAIPHSQAVDNYKELLAICPVCRQEAIREALRMVKTGGLAALRERTLGNAQKSREEKQRERREQRVATLLGRITKEILRRKAAGEVREEVTSDVVAMTLSIGGATGGNVMMERLRANGYRITWPILRGDIWDKGVPRQLQKNDDKKSGVTPEKTNSKIVEAKTRAAV